MLGYDEELYFDEPENEDEDIAHYGTPRHSGRYPWGSGKNPQRGIDLLTRVEKLQKKGLSQTEQAIALGFKTTTELRAAKSQASAARQADFDKAIKAQIHRLGTDSPSAIGRALGVNESTIRGRLKAMQKPVEKQNAKVLDNTMQILREEVARTGGYIDVGKGSNLFLNITESRLSNAVKNLEAEGYSVIGFKQENQMGTPNAQTFKLLCPKGTTWADVKNNKSNIHMLNEAGMKINNDTGDITKIGDPISVDPKRIYVRYKEDGGAERDGTIEIRPGVPDANLGASKYAQVRVLVGENQYMKGIAHYSDKVPEGYDFIYNSNKSSSQPDKVFKTIDEDKMNDPDTRPVDRFGALISAQNHYTDKDGNEHQGVLNIIANEGSRNEWSNSLPSQFLAKQPTETAKQQLAIDYTRRAQEFEEIKSLTNPALKKALLAEFADECDSAAVDLKAAGFPRQGWHTIVPNPNLKDNEVYAPNFQHGEKVVLVRFPHEGPFQMPELIVNNNSRSSKAIIGADSKDAICINSKVADRMSGADFDGDTVLVIPNNDGRLKSMAPLEGLKNFDTKTAYPPIKDANGNDLCKASVDKAKVDKEKAAAKAEGREPRLYLWQEQKQMGMVSNLITDMTLAGATADELARAVRHSMTVIDVKKHNLDWRRSERENNIQELKNKYQPKEDLTKPGGGASTLLSRSKSEVNGIIERKRAFNVQDENGNYLVKDGVDVKTGEKVYQPTGRGYDKPGKNGEWVHVDKTISSTKMYETPDARTLMSGPNHEGTKIERIYADYANRCKGLGNEARKAWVNTTLPKRDPVAAKEYAKEVASLKVKLNESKKRRPIERLAHVKAAEKIKSRQKYEQLSPSDWSKERAKELARAREQLGIKRYNITFTPREWEAIQKNAVSSTTLKELFARADKDMLKKLAMPKNTPTLSPAKIARIKAYVNAGRTQSEIAEALGISVSTVRDALER